MIKMKRYLLITHNMDLIYIREFTQLKDLLIEHKNIGKYVTGNVEVIITNDSDLVQSLKEYVETKNPLVI